MSRKSRREIEDILKRLRAEDEDMEISVEHSTVTVSGPETETERPEDLPEDATRLPTESPVVTWWEYEIDTDE